ncbi:MAG: hypothetical protein R3Y32_05130 [Bacillota bacterium]
MNNTQQLFEIQITQNGESFLLTKQTRSPFVKSDVFAMSDYKRTMVTLLGSLDTVLQSGKMFFDCDLNEDTKVVYHSPQNQIYKSHLDFTPVVIPEKTFMQKVLGFFKGETLPAEILPSVSFICLQDEDTYHFIGALCEDTHTVSFDVDPITNQVVAKINTTAYPCPHDSLLFDIIEMQGSAEFIAQNFYELIKKLYKKQPKVSPQMAVMQIATDDCFDIETVGILNAQEDFTLATIAPEKNNFSLSAYIQHSEKAVSALLSKTSENVFPIAVISPLICEKNSTEYELFKADLVKNAKGKPYEFLRDGKTLYILDIYSKAFKGYLARQMDLLLGMGFCGFEFRNLDLISQAIKIGKAQGETIKLAYTTLIDFSKDKLTIASGVYSTIATGLFDYFITSENVEPTPQVIDKNQPPQPQTALDWNFDGFESMAQYFDSNKKFGGILPVAVDCSLLTLDPLLFDLCSASSMLASKTFNVINPTADAMARLSEFAFLADAVVHEIIHIETGRFAVIFTIENQSSVCFFNFTPADWITEEFNIPALSFNFQE